MIRGHIELGVSDRERLELYGNVCLHRFDRIAVVRLKQGCRLGFCKVQLIDLYSLPGSARQ